MILILAVNVTFMPLPRVNIPENSGILSICVNLANGILERDISLTIIGSSKLSLSK